MLSGQYDYSYPLLLSLSPLTEYLTNRYLAAGNVLLTENNFTILSHDVYCRCLL